MHRRKTAVGLLCAAATMASAVTTHAGILTHEVIPVIGSGNGSNNGGSASDMVFGQYQTNNSGWGFDGGSADVQGNAPTKAGGTSNAANVALSFVASTYITSLNTAYGVGNWAIANPVLNFNSANTLQNNALFGGGAGTFNIFWVANDTWNQSAGTMTDRGSNPIYATNQTTLNTWAGSSSLLGSESFSYSGSTALSYSLAADPTFESDIYSAANGTDPNVSLYLMGTSSGLGMIVYTGGTGGVPTLSFDVVSVPEPTMLCAGALMLLPLLKRRSRE